MVVRPASWGVWGSLPLPGHTLTPAPQASVSHLQKGGLVECGGELGDNEGGLPKLRGLRWGAGARRRRWDGWWKYQRDEYLGSAVGVGSDGGVKVTPQ